MELLYIKLEQVKRSLFRVSRVDRFSFLIRIAIGLNEWNLHPTSKETRIYRFPKLIYNPDHTLDSRIFRQSVTRASAMESMWSQFSPEILIAGEGTAKGGGGEEATKRNHHQLARNGSHSAGLASHSGCARCQSTHILQHAVFARSSARLQSSPRS